jgi:biopolymer transport protein ExbB
MVIARGISEALNTTVAGLVIAIPSLIAHSYYTKKVERMMVEMESICMDLLAKLYLQPEEER